MMKLGPVTRLEWCITDGGAITTRLVWIVSPLDCSGMFEMITDFTEHTQLMNFSRKFNQNLP